MRGPTGLAPVFGVSARTVQRPALELGLVEPGTAVHTEHQAPGGSIERIYTSSTAAALDISNIDLDTQVTVNPPCPQPGPHEMFGKSG